MRLNEVKKSVKSIYYCYVKSGLKQQEIKELIDCMLVSVFKKNFISQSC